MKKIFVIAALIFAGIGCGGIGGLTTVATEPAQTEVKLYELTHNNLEPAAIVVFDNGEVKDFFQQSIGTYTQGDGPDFEMEIGQIYYLADFDPDYRAWKGLYQDRSGDTKVMGSFELKEFSPDLISLIKFAIELVEGREAGETGGVK